MNSTPLPHSKSRTRKVQLGSNCPSS